MLANYVLTIIIPTFNYGHFLPRTLRSILQQEVEGLEVIIVNDGSTDDTETVLQKYTAASNVNVQVIAQDNFGPSVARNVGLRHAQGEYILFLDADDELLPDSLSPLLQTLKQNINAQALLTGHASCNLKGTIKTPPLPQLSDSPKSNFLLLINKKINMMNGTVVLKRDALGELQFSEQLYNYEDLVFYLQVVSTLRCQVLDIYLTKINHHPQSQRSRLVLDENLVETSEKALFSSFRFTKRNTFIVKTIFLQPLFVFI